MALILALTLGLIPAAFAQTWSLTATPDSTSYVQSALVTITGTAASGGAPQAGVLVGVNVRDPASTVCYNTIVTTITGGTYSTQFRLRSDAPTGTYTISATASSAGVQVATASGSFTVTSATSLTLTPTYAAPDASVTFSGTGFTAGQSFTLRLTWTGLTISLASGTVATGGTISGTFTVPDIQSAVHTITATDGAGLTATALFGIAQVDLTDISAKTDAAKAAADAAKTAGDAAKAAADAAKTAGDAAKAAADAASTKADAAKVAADAATTAAQAATTAAQGAKTSADSATTAANAAKASADAAKASIDGLTTMVYVAIGASVVAALAAIFAVMQISKKIA
jgi:hypothetical protein